MLALTPTVKFPLSSLFARLVNRIWPLLLIATLILGGLSFPRTVRLFNTISTDPIDLLPHHHPNVQTLMAVRAKLEKGSSVSLVFESDRPEATRRYMESVVQQLKNHPLVGEVVDRKVGFHFFDRYKLLYIDLEDLKTIRDRIDRRIQKEKLQGLLIDLDEEDSEFQFGDIEKKYKSKYSEGARSEYFMSDDGRIYNIYVRPKNQSKEISVASEFQGAMEQFARQLRPTEADPTMKVYLAGVGEVLEYRALLQDLTRAGIISGILIFLPLLFRFRNPLTVGLIFLPLVVGIPISLAATSLIIPRLNVTTSFLFAILGGLGVENGIHVLSRYREIRLAGKSRLEGLEDIYHHTGRAILTSVASVAITFLLLAFNEFRGFSEFGLMSGLGLWILFFLYFSFFPALLIFAERVKILKFRLAEEKEVRLPINLKPRMVSSLLIVFLVFSVFSVVVPPFLRFEYDSEKIRADLPEVALARAKKRLAVPRVNNPAVAVIQSAEEAEFLKNEVSRRRNGNPDTTIDTSRSYFDLVPFDQGEKLAVIGQIKKLLEDKTIRLVKGENRKDLDEFKKILGETTPVAEKDIPPEVKEIFFGKPGTPGQLFFINAIASLRLDDGRNAMKFAQEVHKIDTPAGASYPSNDAVIYGLVLKTMFQDIWKVLLLSFLSIAFFIFIDFRSLRKTGIVLLSIVTGVFWLLGIMWLFGIKFNMYNIIIIPAVMGMSIDNSIHVYHRYEELGKGSLKKVLSTTGLAAGLASVTNAAGFFGLLTSIHGGLYSIGLLAVLGVATCLVSTLIFLPVFLTFLEKKA